jgi:hypothetical protein
MKRLAHPRRLILPATIFVLTACAAAYSQPQTNFGLNHTLLKTTRTPDFSYTKPNSSLGTVITAVEYPKPDFTAMEEFFEIVKYTYDFQSSPYMFIVVKKKVEDAPMSLSWGIKWLDEDGVVIIDSTILDFANHSHYDVGEPIRVSARAPTERKMAVAKSIIVYRILRG